MSQKKRILIVGGSGFVGTNLAKQLSGRHEVISTHRNEFTRIPGIEYVPFNGLQDKERCTALTGKYEPNVVIYAAGSNDPIKAEKDAVLTQLTHLTGPNQMLVASEYVKAKYIYLSSDFIFGGIEGNYAETDTAIPFHGLGKTKLGTENYIRSRSLNHIIIRCAPLLGRGTLDHPSWLDQIRESEILKNPKAVSKLSRHNPIHIQELGVMIERIIEADVRNKTLHLGGLTKISLYDLAIQFLQGFDYQTKELPTPKSGNDTSVLDFSLNFSQSLKLLKTEPLLLKQSLDLLK